MKNIHILPTNKTSRLIHNDANQLIYQSNNSFKNDKKWMYRKAFNIYITSDEEIKEGDWCIEFTPNNEKITELFKCNEEQVLNISTGTDYKYKKIILTTDQDLIKDGVQAIDDEFLEWFVKNPCCEEVEVESWQPYADFDFDYKIIIPKEEKLEEAAEKYEPKTNKCTIQEIFKDGAKWQQEKDNEVIQNLKDRLDTVRHINTTVIKAVEKLKEQYDSMYSEEEVFNLLMEFSSRDINSSSGTPHRIAKWFEKFKNK